jgi:DNA-binding PadR family transcriptional regulator
MTSTDPSLLVLASLADGDKHGYAIMTDVREFAGLDLGPGTLYGAITRLEARGFIKALAADDRRRPYRLTVAGRAHLQAQLDSLEPIVRVGTRRLRQA